MKKIDISNLNELQTGLAECYHLALLRKQSSNSDVNRLVKIIKKFKVLDSLKYKIEELNSKIKPAFLDSLLGTAISPHQSNIQNNPITESNICDNLSTDLLNPIVIKRVFSEDSLWASYKKNNESLEFRTYQECLLLGFQHSKNTLFHEDFWNGTSKTEKIGIYSISSLINELKHMWIHYREENKTRSCKEHNYIVAFFIIVRLKLKSLKKDENLKIQAFSHAFNLIYKSLAYPLASASASASASVHKLNLSAEDLSKKFYNIISIEALEKAIKGPAYPLQAKFEQEIRDLKNAQAAIECISNEVTKLQVFGNLKTPLSIQDGNGGLIQNWDILSGAVRMLPWTFVNVFTEIPSFIDQADGFKSIQIALRSFMISLKQIHELSNKQGSSSNQRNAFLSITGYFFGVEAGDLFLLLRNWCNAQCATQGTEWDRLSTELEKTTLSSEDKTKLKELFPIFMKNLTYFANISHLNLYSLLTKECDKAAIEKTLSILHLFLTNEKENLCKLNDFTQALSDSDFHQLKELKIKERNLKAKCFNLELKARSFVVGALFVGLKEGLNHPNYWKGTTTLPGSNKVATEIKTLMGHINQFIQCDFTDKDWEVVSAKRLQDVFEDCFRYAKECKSKSRLLNLSSKVDSVINFLLDLDQAFSGKAKMTLSDMESFLMRLSGIMPPPSTLLEVKTQETNAVSSLSVFLGNNNSNSSNSSSSNSSMRRPSSS